MKKRVLVLDDEPAILTALVGILADEGYEIEAFSEAAKAVVRLSQQEFDCVVSDILMPGMSGLDVLDHARRYWPETAVVLITGAPELKTASEAVRRGASDYVVKPIFDKGIERIVARAIERSELQKAIRLRNSELELLLEASRTMSLCERPEQIQRLQKEFTFRAAGMGAPGGTTEMIVNLAREIRSRLESERMREKARLGALLESHPAGIVYLDVEGLPSVVSTRAARLLSLGHSPAGAPSVLPDEISRALSRIPPGGGVAEVESSASPGRMLEIRAAPVADGSRPLGTILSIVDVTAQRENELEAHLSARLASTGQLLQGLCHELNNPLTIVLGETELLSDSPDEQVREGAGRIGRAAARLSDLLMRFVRIADTTAERAEPVDLGEEARAVLQLVQASLTAHRIERVDEIEHSAIVRAKSGELKALLLAIVSNAMDAMPSGGTLTIRSLAAREGAQRVTGIEVADSGVGMPPEVLRQAFDPFFTTKPVGHGSGLGLTLVRAIAVRLGGKVELSSEDGRGSVVRLWLPVLEAAEP